MIEVENSSYDAARAVEALAPHMAPERLDLMRRVARERLGSVALGIEDLHHNHNGAACLRTAEGLGVQHVAAVELRHAYPLDRARPQSGITMAADHWIDLHRFREPEALLGFARSRGMRVFGAGPRGTLTLESLPVDRPLMVLFGNEKRGLQDETMEACDDVFRIPMHGFVESFNVSVSVGMTLQAVVARVRARLDAAGRAGDLSPEEHDDLLARWCVSSVRGAGAILRRKLG